jgi:hypothetical protein
VSSNPRAPHARDDYCPRPPAVADASEHCGLTRQQCLPDLVAGRRNGGEHRARITITQRCDVVQVK